MVSIASRAGERAKRQSSALQCAVLGSKKPGVAVHARGSAVSFDVGAKGACRPGSVAKTCILQAAVFQCPDRGLGPIGNLDLTKNGFHMHFNGRFGDFACPGDDFIRVSSHEAVEDLPLAFGQLRAFMAFAECGM